MGRTSEWMENSFAFMSIELLLLGEIQALGELDIELIEELPKINLNSKEDSRKKRRHLLLSKLWVLGAYELIRFLNDLNKQRIFLNENTKEKLKETLSSFNKIRVPLAKFQKSGKNPKLYESVADSFWDLEKGVGWKVYTFGKKELKKEIFYREELGEVLLELLKEIKKNLVQQV